LDEVKGVNIGNEMAVTISIGLGANGEEYTQNCEYSRIAIDLALGRGGDQAVVKDGEKIYFYGGKSKQVEKNTRVKARVKAHALRELLESKEKIVIMGHKIGDIDSLGAAIGIYVAAKSIGKPAYIVINEITTSIRPMLELFTESGDYDDDMFINSERAIEMVSYGTAVVVVDVSRPSYVECPEILNKTKDIVVLDHHRRSSDTIENASLSYIEPYASSASEMVAEILQYFTDGIKLKPVEAEAMYGGIMIDTNNFSKKTGVRTFEAAAFLRKCGADVTNVRKLFRDSFDDYKAKAEAISSAEAFEEVYAMAVCPSEGIDSPTVLGAQIANELLNINGVKASFVLTEHNHKVYVSARSMGDINVQLIMERLGGGGHLDTAGAQMENVSIYEAKGILKNLIRGMEAEKEI
jgi:c-di-AMP phosphodiesterase-like protein